MLVVQHGDQEAPQKKQPALNQKDMTLVHTGAEIYLELN